jgi:hypothetical protein
MAKQKILKPMAPERRADVYARTNHQDVFRPTPAQRRRIRKAARRAQR